MRNVVLNRIGENIYALFEGDEIVELKISRTQNSNSLKLEQEYCARIKTIDMRLNAAFVDLGEFQALLPFSLPRPKYIVEGGAILAKVTRPQHSDKLAIVAYLGDASPKAICPVLIKDIAQWGNWPDPSVATKEESEKIRDILFEISDDLVALKNGGNIKIEETRALCAIDIDASGRIYGGTNQSNFNFKLNQEAAHEIARQIRLRNIGGLIVIDFVGVPSKSEALILNEILQKNLKTGQKCEVLPVSKFGLCEIARARVGNPSHEILKGIESIAINAINELADKLTFAKGEIITLQLNEMVNNFLEKWHFDWQNHLREHVGGRYQIKIDNIKDYEIY